METTTTTVQAPASNEGSEPRRPAWSRWLLWAAIIIVFAAAADLLGWDIRGWLSDVWDTMTEISTAALVVSVIGMFVQTSATAFAWYTILRFGYPGRVLWRDVWAAYAVSVALNSVLPANLGTLVMLIMFSVVIAGATFAGILGGYAVEKIFFTVSGTFVYAYLFLTVGGSFDIKFAFVHERPVATVLLIAATVFILVTVARRLWPRIQAWWEQAKEGGVVLAHRGAYFGKVFLPSFIAWVASITVIGVQLNAYGIPVTFDTLMHVLGGNSLANVTSVTPGGAGVTQAFNVASLNHVATPTQATAYSVAHQLIGTAWNIVFAIVLMVWAWGWTGGKALVKQSYETAKEKEEAEREKRRQKKAAEAEAEAAG
jgi:uncharacterized membrane protein YbhN (UPF0104 family)